MSTSCWRTKLSALEQTPHAPPAPHSARRQRTLPARADGIPYNQAGQLRFGGAAGYSHERSDCAFRGIGGPMRSAADTLPSSDSAA